MVRLFALPNELLYVNPKAWKEIYAHRQGKEEMAKERRFYEERPGGGHIILANHKNHLRLRRTISHAFSDSSMREHEPLIKRYLDLRIRRLGGILKNG
jgi:cytochrome P450